MQVTIGPSAKNWFFDRDRVIKGMDRATKRALSKIGAFIRRSARSSMRKRNGPSRPGMPPNVHTGLLKDRLFFAYEPTSKTVVVGPEALSSSSTVPGLMEFGGTVVTKSKRWLPAGLKRGTSGRFTSGGLVTVEAGSSLDYAARPFMGPALEKNESMIPKAFEDALE